MHVGYEETERNVRLFAEKVIPALKAAGVASAAFDGQPTPLAATA